MITGCKAALFLLCFASLVVSQMPQDLERDVIPQRFVDSRPGTGTASGRRARYRSVSMRKAARDRSAPATQLGLTIWRLRPASASDAGERIIVQEEGELAEWIPERVETGRPLRIGERIRMSIESQQAGYLYIVNREQYSNGSKGDPILIFPTLRTHNGKNHVTAGRLVEIPAQEDRPNFFTLRRSRMDQVGEEVLLLITPEPIPDLRIGPQSLKLDEELIEKWEQAWKTLPDQFELIRGGPRTWTRAEREAGNASTRFLTPSDPGPQTIFQVAAGADKPRLIKLEFRYASVPARSGSMLRSRGRQMPATSPVFSALRRTVRFPASVFPSPRFHGEREEWIF